MKCIVSACLLGKNCKYNGGNNYNAELVEFCEKKDCIAICPEELGGLASPREPAEIVGKRVLSKTGRDLTQNFHMGAEKSLNIARENKVGLAILKSKSPSCGCGEVYDGSFNKKLRKGNGLTAEIFLQNGISVFNENDISLIGKKEEE